MTLGERGSGRQTATPPGGVSQRLLAFGTALMRCVPRRFASGITTSLSLSQ